MAEFPAIEFEIRGKDNNAAKSLRDFASALNKVANVSKRGDFKGLAEGLKAMRESVRGGGRSFASFATGLTTLFDALKGADAHTYTLQNLANILGHIKDIGKISIPKNIGDGIRNIAEATAKISPESLENLDRMTAYLQRLSGIDLSGFSRVWNRVGKASQGGKGNALVPQQMGLANFMPSTDKELLDDLEKWMNVQGGSGNVPSSLAGIGSGIADFAERGIAALDRIGAAAKSAAQKLFELGKRVVIKIKDNAVENLKSKLSAVTGLFRSIGRIAFYRAIRSAIRAVTKAFSEGIKDLYGWSKAAGGATIAGKTFAQAMDSLATSGGYFKNSIGAMAGPLISALAPAIDFVIDKIVALINVLNQLFALLGGATSWNRATRKAQEFEDAAGGAGGAAKEALRYLAPFDELNVLPDDKKGGGGGGGATDYSDMFEETSEFLEGIQDFVANIKKRWENQDWVGLGIYLGDKINELVDSINFAGAGEKVGEAINAWFTTKYWTIKEINFENIGAKIAEFLNNALENIEFSVIGRSFAQKFTILPDIIIGFINQADWKQIGVSIGDWIRGVLNEWTEWLGTIDWGGLGYKIAKSLGELIDGTNPSALATSIKNFISKGISSALELLTGFAKALFGGETFEIDGDMDANIEIKGLSLTDGTGQSGEGWRKALRDALPLLIGAIGFKVGGFAGAAFGAAIGISIASNIKDLSMSDGTGKDVNGWRELLKSSLPGLVSALGFEVGGIKGAIFGATIGLGIKSAIEVFEFIKGGPADNVDAMANAIKDALPAIGAGIGLFVGGPGGALLGALIGIGLNLFISAIEWTDRPSPTGSEGGGNALGGINVKELTQGIQGAVQEELDNNPIAVSPDVEFEWHIDPVTFEWTYGPIKVPAQATVESYDTNADGSLKIPTATPKLNALVWGSGTYTKSDGSLSTCFKQPWMNTYAWASGTYKHSDGSLSTGFGTPWMKVTASVDTYTVSGSLTDSLGRMKVRTNAVIEATTKAVMNAKGGVYSGGQWHNVQQFASGGLARGSQLFWAREQGPELVGTLGGHTAVMNNDQIVASVSDGVARAIASIKFHMTGLSATPPAIEDESMNEDAMYRAIVRAIADSDLGGDIELDGEKLYRSVVRRNRQNTRATGVNQLATA